MIIYINAIQIHINPIPKKVLIICDIPLNSNAIPVGNNIHIPENNIKIALITANILYTRLILLCFISLFTSLKLYILFSILETSLFLLEYICRTLSIRLTLSDFSNN